MAPESAVTVAPASAAADRKMENTSALSTAAQLGDDATIEADDPTECSDYASDPQSDTVSVTSSVRSYVYENGRRYHRYGGEGKYILPNDEAEQDRLDLMHHVLLMCLGGELHMAPVKNPQTVLDCGTGTGIWALDFGDANPQAKVTGVDLSPIQPGWTAPNVHFEVDDLEKDWTWPLNHFDYINIRSICNGIRDYQRLVNQAFSHTKPNGWVELAEHSFDAHAKDGSMGPETAIAKYKAIAVEGYKKMGIVFPTATMMRECMEKAGFVDIQTKTVNIPWGPWPKNRKLRDIGATFALGEAAGFEAYGLASMTRAMGMEIGEAKELCQKAYNDILNRNIHVVGPIYYVYGRKPE